MYGSKKKRKELFSIPSQKRVRKRKLDKCKKRINIKTCACVKQK